MEPLEIVDFVFINIIGRATATCGINFMDPDFKFNFGSWLFLMIIIHGLMCNVYTVYRYDFDTVLNALIFLPFMMQAWVKFFTVALSPKALASCVHFLRNIHLKNQNIAGEDYMILARWARRYYLLGQVFTLVLIFNFAIIIVYPFFVRAVTGEWTTMYPIYVAGIDETTRTGFWSLFGVHMIWIVLTLIGLTASDLMLMMLALWRWPMIDLFEHKFEKLNTAARHSRVARTKEVSDYFRNLIYLHLDICNYTANLARIFRSLFFFDTNTNGLSLCFILFASMLHTWVPMYMMFVMFFTKLLVLCGLGTSVDLGNAKLLDVIQRSNWHLLPIPMQRSVQLMMMRAQKPTTFKAGTVPLNLDTFVNILKSVFQVAMILTEMEF